MSTPHGDWVRGKPRPHVHPSVNCYKAHKCRCPECRELWNAQERARLRRKRGLAGAGLPRYPKPLPEWELMALRREIGLIK